MKPKSNRESLFFLQLQLLIFFSGKTTLSKAISTVASTAAFDKNPQSKERGITLDLGFSSFSTPSAEHMQKLYPQTQYTLVDCPGHGKNLDLSFHILKKLNCRI